MSWIKVQLRRLADARAATGALVGLTLVTAALFAAAPRVMDVQADRALRSTVDTAPAGSRNLALSENGRIAPGATDSLAEISDSGDQLRAEFPASVSGLVRARYVAVDTPRFGLFSDDGPTIRLRSLEGASDHVRIVEGRLPTAQTTTWSVAPGSLGSGATAAGRPLPEPGSVTAFEVALSTQSAAVLDLHVGAVYAVRTDTTDRLAGQSIAFIAVRIVGIFEVPDGSSDYWFSDTTLERPNVRSISRTSAIDDVTALLSGEAYPAILAATRESGLQIHYAWRFQIDSSRLTAAGAANLLRDLRRMDNALLASSAVTDDQLGGSDELRTATLETGLPGLIEVYGARWRVVSQVLSVAEVGSGAVALLALGLICLLAGRRRSRSQATWKSRGSSRRQALAATYVDVALELVLPTAAGLALAFAFVPAGPTGDTVAAAGAVLVFAAIIFLAGAWSASEDTAAVSARGSRDGESNRPGGSNLVDHRRLAVDVAVVLAAAVGAFVLRQRGVAAAGSSTELTSPDPFLAAVPVLIGLAAALVVVRILPVPVALLARLAERDRGLVAPLALRRATRRTSNRMLLTVLLVMAAVGSFAAVSLAWLQTAVEASSWRTVGAAYRLGSTEGALPADLDLAAVPGVEAVAGGAAVEAATVDGVGGPSLLVLDLGTYRDVVAGGPIDGVVPRSMIDAESATQPGSPRASSGATPTLPLLTAAEADAAAPIPAIVSAGLAKSLAVQEGETFRLLVRAIPTSFVAVSVRDAFPSLPFGAGASWLVASRRQVAAAGPGLPIAATEAFVRGGPDARGTLAAAARAAMPGRAVFSSRDDEVSGLRSSPDYVAVAFGLAAASAVAAAYGALAILATLLLSGAEQSRESAHLRILGLGRRETLELSAIEHGPVSIAMIAAGIGLGLGLFAFLLPSLGLGRLVGGDIDVGLPVSGLELAAIGGAIAALVGLAIAIEAVAESMIEPTAALRRGID